MQIFTNQSADGNSEEFKYIYATKPLNLYVSGDLGGGTITIQAKAPDGTWVDVENGTITGATLKTISTAYPFTGRLSLTGATTPSVNAWVVGQTA